MDRNQTRRHEVGLGEAKAVAIDQARVPGSRADQG